MIKTTHNLLLIILEFMLYSMLVKNEGDKYAFKT